MKNITVVNHPLIQHRLAKLRNKNTKVEEFRKNLYEISLFMGLEVTKNLKTKEISIDTPLSKTKSIVLENEEIILVSILRAGNGFLDGMLKLFPKSKVGFIGLKRHHKDLTLIEYFYNVPKSIKNNQVILLDPMLATGITAVEAINKLKNDNPDSIKYMGLLAAPEGIEYLHKHHPDVEIYVACVDNGLNKNNFILPGLGDVGDRMYGTEI